MISTTVNFKTTDATVATALFSRQYLFGKESSAKNAIAFDANKGVYSVSLSIRPSFTYAVTAFLRANKAVIAK